MTGLLIETCTERSLMAICRGTDVVHISMLPKGYHSSKNLLPEIGNAFKALAISAKELDYVAVGIGPGSYTGIRVGAAAAQAIAFARDLPLIGLCTLHSFCPSKEGPFAVLIDAKISGSYVVTGTYQGGEIEYQSEPAVVPLEELGKSLCYIPLLITPQEVPLRMKLESLTKESSWQWEETAPDPHRMALLAAKKFAAKDFAVDGKLELLYLRKTQAEMERE